MLENKFNEIQAVQQKVTYIETDGTERAFEAIGDADRIEVFMPEAEEIDVQYAADSIMDLRYREVIVGVISEEGVLFVPEDAKQLIRDYLYSLSIKNDDIHVILDWDTVNNISKTRGDMTLYVHHAGPDDLNGRQKRTVGDNLAISVRMLLNDEYVSDLGGHADIYVDTEKEENVYYVDEGGNAIMIESEYSDGVTHTNVNHFSIYMYTNEVPASFDLMLVLVLVGIVLLILLLIIVLKRHKKS